MNQKQDKAIQTNKINTFLFRNKIKLMEGEKVLNVLRTKLPYTPNKERMAMVVGICFTVLLIGINFFTFQAGTMLVFTIMIIGVYVDYSYYQIEDSFILGLITTKGIRTKQSPLISWSKVYNIRKYDFYKTPYLVFDLIEKPTRTEWNEFNLHIVHESKDFIFWGGSYDAHEMYNKLLPYWEPHDPMQIPLIPIRDHLSDTYQLTEKNRTEKQVTLQSKQPGLALSCSYSKRLPFKQLTASFTLEKPVTAHLNIQQETNTSKVKRAIGIKDILIGDHNIDQEYLFQSSHSTAIQELFSEELIGLFRRLSALGTVNWSFGKPLKQERLQAPKSSIQDTEDVLDTGLLKTEDPKATYKVTDENTYDKLEFNGILNPDFEDDPKNAATFVELSMELSVLLAEGLKEIDKDLK